VTFESPAAGRLLFLTVRYTDLAGQLSAN